MKPIESLKARLSNDKLLVQNEKGFLSTVGFEWNPAATDKEIAEFETVLHHQLPAEFKEFLKISNGATFFKDLDYGQWGFHILPCLNTPILATHDRRNVEEICFWC